MADYIKNIAESFREKISEIKANPVNSQGVIIKSVPIQQLIRIYNLDRVQNLKVIDNPYTGKVNQDAQKDAELYTSPLGTPVVINLKFASVEYTDLLTGRQKFTNELTFDTVLCTVSQAKRIVRTEIQGADGTVKEYIGLDDYNVQINGIICGDNGRYPAAEVDALKRMLDAPVAIPVISSYLNRLGVYNVVVQDYSLPQEAGGYSKQDFSIMALSDTPLELQIT